MLGYILRRCAMLIPVILGVVFIVFVMMYVTPGDPARMVLGEQAPQEDVDNLRAEMGLDDPFLFQFGRYVYKAVVHGDIGRSYITKRPVWDELMTAFPITLKLSALAMGIALLVGIPCGIVTAVKQYSIFDNIVTLFALIGISMPVFWLGLLLILLFTVKLAWLPPSGFDSLAAMVMPAVTLGLQSVAIITRMTRSSMLEVVRQDYIRTARSKGQKESVVIRKHALPNALVPVVTIAGIQFGILLGGAVLTEIIFSIPGLGRLMVSSIEMRDYPMVQGGVLFIALAFCLVNLGVDLLYAWLDPRIKSQYT
ncbi:nickel ABC transporter permease [Desulfoluna spongiiphila]|uniref:Peptide/nickel transport system permease protein n=1 Tax=Desulfoluna spongiiphila TaxID=419481 RepID=A0A1G5GS41_9BACT|nr:nickel ABC transporter permease [Desulfoluna spongiiphila]SCY54363.1 peptide/nickel transport system permease protein [Desulfoluna spongiiphila]VVS92874.1 abc transporter type 1 transmembrane domain meti-like [Desulfoluna spongiiphila]